MAAVSLEGLLSLARELALRAGEEHLAGRRRPLRVERKSSPTDLVSQVDRRAEELIVDGLASARPQDAILAEEGALAEGSSGVRWLIDPLDGTTNYVYGYPASCVSIAAEVDGCLRIGVVHDPLTRATYEAIAGRQAVCNGRPIAVRDQQDLSDALVATGFSYDAAQRERQAAALVHVLPRIRDIRRAGSAALDLCLLAAGHVDAFWELDLSPWDYAAGTVIAGAAGAEVRTLDAAHGGGPAVAAASASLLPSFLRLLEEAGALRGPDLSQGPAGGGSRRVVNATAEGRDHGPATRRNGQRHGCGAGFQRSAQRSDGGTARRGTGRRLRLPAVWAQRAA